MRKLARLALVAFAILAPGACTQQAAGAGPDHTARALEIAYRAFPGGPCEGRAVVQYVDDLTRQSVEMGVRSNGDRALGLYSPRTPCVLYVEATLGSWTALCSVIVHEYGHSALGGTEGEDHSYPGAHGVMRGEYYPGCNAMPGTVADPLGLARPVSRRDALATVLRALRRGQRTTLRPRIHCAPTRRPNRAGVPWACALHPKGDRHHRRRPVGSWLIVWDIQFRRAHVVYWERDDVG